MLSFETNSAKDDMTQGMSRSVLRCCLNCLAELCGLILALGMEMTSRWRMCAERQAGVHECGTTYIPAKSRLASRMLEYKTWCFAIIQVACLLWKL